MAGIAENSMKTFLLLLFGYEILKLWPVKIKNYSWIALFLIHELKQPVALFISDL